MRVISGRLKGRRFEPPAGLGIRPTTDRAREALFNILTHRYDFTGSTVLDLFAGSGGVALEFLSRGAAHVTVVEAQPKVATYLRKLFTDWDIAPQTEVVQLTAEKFVGSETSSYNFIFMDPPYARAGKDALIAQAIGQGMLQAKGCLILEHPAHEDYLQNPYFNERRAYGLSTFSFFTKP